MVTIAHSGSFVFFLPERKSIFMSVVFAATAEAASGY